MALARVHPIAIHYATIGRIGACGLVEDIVRGLSSPSAPRVSAGERCVRQLKGNKRAAVRFEPIPADYKAVFQRAFIRRWFSDRPVGTSRRDGRSWNRAYRNQRPYFV